MAQPPPREEERELTSFECEVLSFDSPYGSMTSLMDLDMDDAPVEKNMDRGALEACKERDARKRVGSERVETYIVLPGCPIPMDTCAVSTEEVAETERPTDSSKESCKVELKPLPANLRVIEVDRAKVKAIEKLLLPKDEKGIRSFSGHADLYRRLIKKWHDKRVVHRSFKEGNRVLLFNSRLRLFPKKLKTRWSSPYTVERGFPDGHVKISVEDGKMMIVNGQRLKDYHVLKGAI